MWSAGLAAAAAAVVAWRIVGPGYTWLAAGVVALFGAFTVAAGGGAFAVTGLVAAVAGGILARSIVPSAVLLGVSGLAFLAAGWTDSPLGLAVSGAVFIGGVTSEMLLGHWYLVDPRLPRWALHRLAYAGGVGLVADALFVGGRVARDGLAADVVFGWAYAALAVMTGLLLLGVWFSLKEPKYTGVMAATGLSYLGVLTAVGTLVVGRLIAYG